LIAVVSPAAAFSTVPAPTARGARGAFFGVGQLSVAVGVEPLERTRLPVTPLFAGCGALGIRQLTIAIGVEPLDATPLLPAVSPFASLVQCIAFAVRQDAVSIAVVLFKRSGAALIAIGLVALRL
jgi:hypothetical protein